MHAVYIYIYIFMLYNLIVAQFYGVRGGASFDQISPRSTDISVGRDRELFHASIGK